MITFTLGIITTLAAQAAWKYRAELRAWIEKQRARWS